MLALGLALSSCSKEEQLTEVPNGEAAALSFKITKPSSPYVTRADIATEHEWNIASFDVYVAVNGGTVAKLVKDKDYKLSPDALNTTNRTYTITMQTAWLNANRGKTVNFYFVGNDATSTAGPHTSLSATNPTETAFKSALSNVLPTIKEGADTGRLAPIHKPDGETKNLLFSSVVEGVVVVGKVEETGKLQRREARFDVKNSYTAADANEFTVTRIFVTNAANAGLIFPTGAATTPIDRTGAYAQITGLDNKTAYTLAAPESEPTAKDLAPAVFYLYPTKMSTDAKDTKIIVMGKVGNGPEQAYPVNVAAETAIMANYRYVISVDPVKGSVIDSVDDMSDWGTLSAESGTNTAAATMTPDTSKIGTGVFNPTTNVFYVSDGTKSTLGLTFKSSYGVDWTIQYSEGSGIEVVETGSVSTRAFTTTNTLTITIPAGDGAIEADIVVNDGVDPRTVKVIRGTLSGDPSGILYLDQDGKLQSGEWGVDVFNIAEIPYFKFGSVVGISSSMSDWEDGENCISFNPSTAPISTYASIPVYTSDLFETIKDISDPNYTNVDNIKAGKGDPCMLVGYTAAELREMSDDELQAVLDNARLRLPTVYENVQFVGGPDTKHPETKDGLFWKDWIEGSPNYNYKEDDSSDWEGDEYTYPKGNTGDDENLERFDWWVTNGYSRVNPSTGSFPIEAQGDTAKGAYTLPAAGIRMISTGATNHQGTTGYFWSSTPESAINAYYLRFSKDAMRPVYRNGYADGFSIRCVAR